MTQVIQTLKNLIAIRSTVDVSNKDIVFYIRQKLQRFESWIYKFKKGDLDLYNLVVKIKGRRKEDPLIFSGHTDTVLPNENWTTNPFKAEITKGKIFGLGSSDMKGALAAMITAADQIKQPPTRDVYLFFTADEEGSALGIKNLMKNIKIKNGFVILGEPTGFNLRLGHMSVMEMKIIIPGRSGHAALATKDFNRKNNSIYKAVDIIKFLQAEEVKLSKIKDKKLGSPLMNIGTIKAGSSVNSIPDKCEMTVSFRLPPKVNIKNFYQRITEGIKKIAPPARVEKLFFEDSFLEEENNKNIASLKKILKELKIKSKIEYSPAWTEASYLKNIGTCVIIGPGEAKQAHKADEYIKIDSLLKAVKVYNQIIKANNLL